MAPEGLNVEGKQQDKHIHLQRGSTGQLRQLILPSRSKRMRGEEEQQAGDEEGEEREEEDEAEEDQRKTQDASAMLQCTLPSQKRGTREP